MIEAEVGRVACEFARFYGLSLLVFEADCLKLVRASSSEIEDDSGFGMVMEDIRSTLLDMPSSFFSHVFREANSLAHRVAKFALLHSVQLSWYGSLPIGLSDWISSPCIS